ncbi:MAG: hypothetical protein QME81_12110 [bacterium]|nr:hypothetical protein [bacterium]
MRDLIAQDIYPERSVVHSSPLTPERLQIMKYKGYTAEIEYDVKDILRYLEAEEGGEEGYE